MKFRYLLLLHTIVLTGAGTLAELAEKAEQRRKTAGHHTSYDYVDRWTEPGFLVEDRNRQGRLLGWAWVYGNAPSAPSVDPT